MRNYNTGSEEQRSKSFASSWAHVVDIGIFCPFVLFPLTPLCTQSEDFAFFAAVLKISSERNEELHHKDWQIDV